MLSVESLKKSYIQRWTHRSLIKSIVRKSFASRETVVFESLSFNIAPGEIVAICGPNGSGKSTLLRLIADVLEPTSGIITRPKRVVPMLSSGAFMHPLLDIRENIENAAVFYGAPCDLSLVESIASRAGLLDRIDEPLSTLSKGMLNRVALSTGLSSPGDLYLIDELLDPLDNSYREYFMNYIKNKSKEGASVMLTSHDSTLVDAICTRKINIKS